MALVIGVPKETVEGENRVSVVPEVVKKFRALGADFCIEPGAGAGSCFRDKEFGEVHIAADASEVYAKSQVIFKVQAPAYDEIRAMREGSILIAFLRPFEDPKRAKLLCERNITSFAVEMIPRVSRAQSMDALTSQ